ncbi:glutaminyl-peptide cyclotransferase [Desulfuromonas versatilis]|uniref:Glutaminyl-peptide cyclotransferase n=2 Tax=Desulfuromonas versatilis TaxID=2802975 RepID=A0ABN6E4N2_9BACT|nr:glutaminyl-peptide cyclotransferase [Desulfuromonas versatilis]
MAAAPVYGYRIVNSYPHDPGAFTQGLVYLEGVLYEGTGLQGSSSLRRVDLESGRVEQLQRLAGTLFGEGIAAWGDKLIQLTYRNRLLLVYDRASFRLLATHPYPREGWGITHDGQRLIVSDGTSVLRFLDPQTFAESGRVAIHDRGRPVERLNELEFVEGEIFANVWQTDRIARIDPQTGEVTGWIDLAGLLPPALRRGNTDVLNGIAYDAKGRRLFVTGKLWPALFEIELLPRP